MQQSQLWTLPAEFGRIDVSGFSVEAVDRRVGKVEQATLDPGASYLIVASGPPLLGKKLLLPAGLVNAIDRDDKVVYLDCNETELNNAPGFDAELENDPIYRGQVAAYYAAGAAPTGSEPARTEEDTAGAEADDH